jgi:predicted nucleic acid-binding protein
MKILFDTNVLLDVLLDRMPFSKDAARLMSHIEIGDISGSICATTVTTIYYIAEKSAGRHAARLHVGTLLKLFDVAPVNRLVLEAALASDISDFEDAVLAASAYHAGTDAIVTRNGRDFKHSPVPVHSPEQLLKTLSQ